MNKTFNYALAVVLGLGIAVSASAQNFPDVPENHWAYDALETMKREGLLVGYPDGLFRGSRPATRYEMAVAIHATYMHLKGITDNLQRQIDELKNAPHSGGGPDLTSALDALKARVDGMQGWGDQIANLQKMTSTFEKELNALDVDVEAMKKDLASLNDRVSNLEKNKPAVLFGGEATFFMQHGAGTSGRWGLGKDGQLTNGTTNNALSRSSGFLDGFSVFHSAVLTMKGTNDTGPKWDAALEIGNLLNGYGSAPGSATAGGGVRNDNAPTDIAFRRLEVEFDHGLLGQNVNFKAGRLGYKVSPYIFQAPDTNPYVKSMYDDGKWTMDGAVLGFNFGPAKLDFVVGRTNTRSTSTGLDLSGVAVGGTQTRGMVAGGGALVGGLGPAAGSIAADSTVGAHLNVPIGDKGSLDLAYLIHSQNTPAAFAPNPDNVHVYGGELNWDMNGIKLNGGVSQTRTYSGNTSVTALNSNNTAWHVGAGFGQDKWGVEGWYREIGMNYGAAGSWGRIGAWWNPRDISSFGAKAHLDLSDSTTLWGKGEWAQGLGKTGGLLKSDKINSYKIGIDHEISEGLSAMVGAELVDYRFAGFGGKPFQRWYDLGVSYSLSDMAKLSFLWEYSDADSKGNGLWAAPNNAAGRFTGHLLTTQFTIRF